MKNNPDKMISMENLEKEELEATEEIRNDREINRQINEARQARLQGKYDEYVPWEMR